MEIRETSNYYIIGRAVCGIFGLVSIFAAAAWSRIFNPVFAGPNNSPILLQPPIDFACVGQPFLHNPNANDLDGDSLSYEFTTPLQDVNTPVPNFSSPSAFGGALSIKVWFREQQ